MVCPVEVTGKNNTKVPVFRELFDRFSIDYIGCSIKINKWFSPEADMDKLAYIKSDDKLLTAALLKSL